ncbi:Branched-chain-amino-acid aminotransferase-like protein 2, partial [Mucuna pruriens]
MAESEHGVEVEIIHSWSTPRSLSTSLMYSFAQRDDVEVLDEPLYANFLRVTGVERPYRDELLSKMESDGNKVVKDIIYCPGNSKYRFCKHMSKQKVLGLTEDLMKKGKHFILIRNPLDILPSFDEVVPPSFFELGLAELVCIYNELCELGKPPPVVDAAELQEDPEVEWSEKRNGNGNENRLKELKEISYDITLAHLSHPTTITATIIAILSTGIRAVDPGFVGAELTGSWSFLDWNFMKG